MDDDRATVSGPAGLEEPPPVVLVDRELFSPAGTRDEAFGSRIAISDVLVVTAPQASVGDKTYAGAADVFVREPASADWAWRKRLTAPDGADFDQFGGSSVAIQDGAIFVGASDVTVDSVVRQGAVYVFERDAGGTDNWGQTAKLTDASAGGSSFFGSSIAVQGDLLAVGAPYGPSAGQVTLFERDRGGPGQWGKVTALLDSAVAGGGWPPEAFGSAVALDGDLLLIGASSADVSYFGQEDGAAYLFRRDGADRDQWNCVTRLTAPEATVCTGDRTLAEISLDDPDALEQVRLCVQQQGQTRNDSFGAQVAIDGDTIVVAATRDSFAVAPGAGVVHVFRSDPAAPDSWEHVTELAGSDISGSAGSGFGRALALAGDVLLVGAPGVAGDSGESQGAVYRFERSAGGTDAWGEVAKLVAADGLNEESFGTAVVLDGGNEIIGTAGFDMSRGAVYLTAELVQQPAFPPTAELADASLIEGPDGILFGAPSGALTDPLPVWVLEVPAPAQPLPPLTTALGSFCNIGAVATTQAPASLPFAIAFPVPESADTAHLGMAMLAPAEEGLDSTESGPVWQRIRGFYDDQNNLFCVALPSLVIDGRTVVLIQDPAVTPVTLDEETPARAADLDVAKFDLDCDDFHDPGACQPEVKQRFTNELVTAYNKFTLLGYKRPALLHHVPRVRQFETGPGEFEIVNTFTYYGSWIYAESSGDLAAEYIYYQMLIYFYPAPGNPDADIPRVTAHELFHAFQFGGTEDETKKTIAYLEWDAKPRFVQKSWIVEGTASAAEDSAETMNRSGWVEKEIGLHPVDRSLLASDKAEYGDAAKEIIAYQAQDFWVYFANKQLPELGLGYLQPLFARGVDLQAAVDFFAQDLGTSLGAEYWSWVKNQAIEKLFTLGGALTDPGRIELPRDRAVIGPFVDVIDYPAGEIHSATWTLPILTAAVVQINITSNVGATIVTAGPLKGGLAYKVYINGECTSEGGPCYVRIPEGERRFDDFDLAKDDTLYVIIANTNTDHAKRIKYTLIVRPAS